MKRLLTALKPPFFIQAELLFFTLYCRAHSLRGVSVTDGRLKPDFVKEVLGQSNEQQRHNNE
jgi:hypothetical protein